MAEDHPVAAPCRLCLVAKTGGRVLTRFSDVISVQANPDVIVLLKPSSRAVSVAPTNHISDLAHFEQPMLAPFLASLRRVVVHARSVFGCSEATIAPLEVAIPDSEGHACFTVVPSFSDSEPTGRPAKPTEQAQRLAKLLG